LEIIIIDAEHLDKKRDLVVNIYERVNEIDGITYTIPRKDYTRAYFEKELTSENVIDVYVRSNEPATIEVYEKDLRAGDLVFTRGTHGHYNPRFTEGVGHIGIYTDDKTVIHAASKRLSEKPIIEEGAVVESTWSEYIEGWKPIVIIRRYIQ